MYSEQEVMYVFNQRFLCEEMVLWLDLDTGLVDEAAEWRY